MIRFALLLLLSLGLSSQAIAAVKWNNSGKIEAEAPFWKGENQNPNSFVHPLLEILINKAL